MGGREGFWERVGADGGLTGQRVCVLEGAGGEA